jgi:two-component system sensor histidine kinase AlgZ
VLDPADPSPPTDVEALLRDTLREAVRSWRLPATLILGVGFGAMEYSLTRHPLGAAFGLIASLYTLCFGPLAWRAMVPLEADGDRWRKLQGWLVAASVSTLLFLILVVLYRTAAHAASITNVYVFGHLRELLVAWLLFLIGGWGLARDIQLEQRHDRARGSTQRLEAALQAARLDALRADLDPHFLFNALNAIASQCATDARAAEENICRLASLLRAVLDTRSRPLHALDDELALCGDYLALLQARYPELRVDVRADPTLADTPVPPLLLQPMLENAVRHGEITRGVVVLEAAREGDTARLSVTSPGAWRGPREGGMGVDLVRSRVALTWGVDARFDITERGGSTVTTITIPLSPKEIHAP